MTEKEAKQYINDYLSHIIEMTEYGNWFAVQIKGLVEDAENDCDKIIEKYKRVTTKKNCNNLKKEIDVVLLNLRDNVDSLIINEVNKLTDEEQEWLEEKVVGPLGLNFNYPDKASKLLLLIPIASAGIVGEYGQAISERLRNIYNQEVMTSYVSGVDFEDIEDETKFNTFYRGLEVDSETLGESLSSQYDRIIYTSNDKKIQKYMWLATLDSNTCIACGELDHTIYTKIEDVPLYAKHSRCRCTVCVVNDEIMDAIPESYSEWFEDQSDKDKYKILGKSRYQLYKDGMKIKQFVNNGKITPLRELNK